jgi:hypothetical protein
MPTPNTSIIGVSLLPSMGIKTKDEGRKSNMTIVRRRECSRLLFYLNMQKNATVL